jgi:histidinol dehydrogenase
MSGDFPGLTLLDLRGDAANRDAAADQWRGMCGRSVGLSGAADEAARAIVERVRAEGDAAVVDCTREFEGRKLEPTELELPTSAADEALASLDPSLRAALEQAAESIRVFHETQRADTTGLDRDGARLRSRISPLRRVALYVPGGTAAYPSSVLMSAIPAKVAGVDELIVLTPRPAPVVLAAAAIAGVGRIFQIGGAQAVAAAAFGTQHVPRVDKIVGPGNAYVTAAKRLVFGAVDIDSIAGPSEILVVADANADPALVAADLISQAEHDTDASAVLVTTSPALVAAVDAALREQLTDLPRAEIATRSLIDNGAAVIVSDRTALARETDRFASEHVELLVEDAPALAEQIRNAGAIFVGAWTPEAAGDYTAGPSHVLPTAGGARFASPLGVWDFCKYTSVLELSPQALRGQADTITTLARAEGLEGHARAVERRLQITSNEQDEP